MIIMKTAKKTYLVPSIETVAIQTGNFICAGSASRTIGGGFLGGGGNSGGTVDPM
jgi:hypothetical protein